MAVLIPLASGKGGVGKSVVAANLAWCMARDGHKVVLVDLDCGGSNAHTLLGVKNTWRGIGCYLEDKGLALADLLVPVGPHGLRFVPGDNLVAGAANMPFIRKRKLMKELAALDADFVLMDLGAGTSFNTVDFFIGGNGGVLVTVPEPTAILNAYSFVKTALYRLLFQTAKRGSPERELVQQFFCRPDRDQEHEHGLEGLYARLEGVSPQAAEKARRAAGMLAPRIVVNMQRSVDDGKMVAHLRSVCARRLDVRVSYIALAPWDDAVRGSVVNREVLAASQADAPFAAAMANLAGRIAAEDFGAMPAPLDSFEDLEELLTGV